MNSGSGDTVHQISHDGENIDFDEAVVFNDGQLSYIGQDVREIPTALSKVYGPGVRRLDLSFNQLKKLDGLEQFPNIEELVLDNNDLKNDINFPRMERLHTLMLNKNNLSDLDALLEKIKSNLPQLTYLSLLGNEACPNQLSCEDKDEEDYSRYRKYVLYKLPKLKFLDSTAVSEKERKEAKTQGKFLKVVTISSQQADLQNEEEIADQRYTPLSTKLREEPDHKASFGKCQYVYYGRHSEGNRFISDNDL